MLSLMLLRALENTAVMSRGNFFIGLAVAQEVDHGGHGHGHEVHCNVEVGHAAHQNDQQRKAKQM